MAKSPDAFRTISEVADWLGIQAHVLRFWESKFAPVKPVKRAGGRRYYRPADMLLLGGIKRLLHDDGMTIKGVQEMLREQGIGHVSALSQSIDEPAFSIEVEIEDVSATVLQFQSNSEVESVAAPEATQDAPDSVLADQGEEHEAVETEELNEPDTATEPDEDVTSVAPEEQPETATLPSFLSRSVDQDDVAETTKPAPLAPQPDIPRAVVVDAPDPGPDDSQNYSPGSLGQLAGLDYLTAEQVEKITPLANELRAWLTRTDAA